MTSEALSHEQLCHVSPSAVPSGLFKKTFLKQVAVTHVKDQFTSIVHCQSGKERAFYWFYQFALCHISGFRFHLLVLLVHAVSLTPRAVTVRLCLLAVATW